MHAWLVDSARRLGTSWTLVLLSLGAAAGAQQPPAPPATETPAAEAAPAAQPPAASAAATLPLEQAKLADKFKRLEELLLRRAEVAAATDPERATLLRQVVAKSKDAHIGGQFEALVELLAKDDVASYGRAITDQATLQKDLKSLLELLSNEDRSGQLQSEKAQIKEFLKRVNRLIRGQKTLQGQTESGADPRGLSERQAKLADDTKQLAGDIQAADEAKQGTAPDGRPADNPANDASQRPDGAAPADPKPSDGKQGDGKQGDRKQGDGKQGDQKPGDGKQGDADGQQGAGKQADGKQGDAPPADPSSGEPKGSQSPGEGQPSPGSQGSPSESQPGQPGQSGQPSPGQGQPGQTQPGSDQGETPPPADLGNPARKRIQAAEERMRKAAERLEQAQREEAAGEQEQARRELEQAAAELERILRQLREEEVERMLVALEARFRKMLEAQTEVYQGTKRLGNVPAEKRDREIDIEAGRLSRKQVQIRGEADRALTLLREEGSAVAFPEAVGQMRDDMQQSADYLAQAKVDRLTQGVQEDILAALEEMIAALEKAIEDLQKKRPQGQPPPGGGEPGDEPLVDQLAELKMIRSLQLRVNRRTAEIGALIPGEQADQDDLIAALQRLAEKQDRIYRSTRDIVVGRNE
jgi:hypothetical protein